MKPGTLLSLAVVLTAAALAPRPASAENASHPLGVVEMFTSQGCSSCPPADAVLGELAKQADVVALAYHVDYWDYLGWRDTLGSKDNTDRQYAYGRTFGVPSVYTPQAVINGRVDVNGSDRSAIAGALQSLAKAGDGLSVDLTVTQIGNSYVIYAGPATGSYRNAHLVLAYFDNKKPVTIDRGENRGSTVTYWNAVTDLQTAGMWHGAAAHFELPASEITKTDGCAVLLQAVDKSGAPGPILGAAVIRRPGSDF